MSAEPRSIGGAFARLQAGSDAAAMLGAALGTLMVPVTSSEPERGGIYWVDVARLRPDQVDALVARAAGSSPSVDAQTLRQELLTAGVYLEGFEVTGIMELVGFAVWPTHEAPAADLVIEERADRDDVQACGRGLPLAETVQRYSGAGAALGLGPFATLEEGSLAGDLLYVALGSLTVPVTSLVPEATSAGAHGLEYRLDLDRLRPEQVEALIECVAGRVGLEVDVVRAQTRGGRARCTFSAQDVVVAEMVLPLPPPEGR